jgi:hypothetical protein
VATAGLELATGRLDPFRLDSRPFAEAQLLTAATVRAPILIGEQFALGRRAP